jgi:sRNA-binding regulator protein Hfq
MGSKEETEEFVITVANQKGTQGLIRATAQMNGTQFKMLQEMVPFYGADEAEVVKNIVVLYIQKTHDIKAWPKPFQEMREGRKTAEFRINDRNYSVGDNLHVREWSPETGEYTGETIDRKITSLVIGGQFGIPEGYCVMSVAPMEPPTKQYGPNFFAKLNGTHVTIIPERGENVSGTIVAFSRYEVLIQEDGTTNPFLLMKHSIRCIIPDSNPFEKKEATKDAKKED